MDGSTEELVSLGELGAGADMGLTGRPVFAGDGTLLGTVADVLGGARGEGPRYIAVLLEAAVRNTILQLRGIDTLQEFMERQRQAMTGD